MGSGVIGALCLCEPMVQAWPTLPPSVLNGQAGEIGLAKTARLDGMTGTESGQEAGQL